MKTTIFYVINQETGVIVGTATIKKEFEDTPFECLALTPEAE